MPLASTSSSISVWQELVHVAAPISASLILDFMIFHGFLKHLRDTRSISLYVHIFSSSPTGEIGAGCCDGCELYPPDARLVRCRIG